MDRAEQMRRCLAEYFRLHRRWALLESYRNRARLELCCAAQQGDAAAAILLLADRRSVRYSPFPESGWWMEWPAVVYRLRCRWCLAPVNPALSVQMG